VSIYSKRHYWGREQYNTRTGRYRGERTYSSDGTVRDWLGNKVAPTGVTGKEGKP
jgi:hypothetical protein